MTWIHSMVAFQCFQEEVEEDFPIQDHFLVLGMTLSSLTQISDLDEEEGWETREDDQDEVEEVVGIDYSPVAVLDFKIMRRDRDLDHATYLVELEIYVKH